MTDGEAQAAEMPCHCAPGDRTSANVRLLVAEAEQLASDRPGPENPAAPTDEETAEQVRQRLDDELLPAWEAAR